MLSITSVLYLKGRGYSIQHVYTLGFEYQSDKVHFEKSRSLKRVLLTLDQRIRRYENFNYKDHPGVVVIKASSTMPRIVNEQTAFVLKRLTEHNVKEALVYGSKDRITQKRGEIITELFKRIA